MSNHHKLEKILSKYRSIISCNTSNEPKPLLNSFNLFIPAYQRPYSWLNKNIRQLLDDLFFQIRWNPNEDYFLGMIFTCKKNDSSIDNTIFEIIDGQQRITTIYLILWCLKNYLVNDVERSFFNNEIKKIHLTSELEQDNKILQAVNKKNYHELNAMFNKNKKEKQNDLLYVDQINQFQRAIKFINKYLLDKNKKDLLNYIFDNVKVLHVICEPNDLIADQFFGSLNGKGLKLDQVDLLKNTFIQPYMMGGKKDLNLFKDKWAKIIISTNNHLDKEINHYFTSKLKKKIPPSKLNYEIQQNIQYDSIKKEFEKMCDFFQKYSSIICSKTNNPKINFYIKLNKKFNFDRYKELLFMSIMKTNDFDIEKNKNISKSLETFLENLFKINFIYLKLFGLQVSRFLSDVIQNKEFKEKNICDNAKLLSNKLKNILDGNDEISDYFRSYNFSDLSYDSKNKNGVKILRLLKLISTTYNNDVKDMEYQKAYEFLDYDLEHIVPKSLKKTLFYNENHKPIKWWKLANNNEIEFINDSFDNIFQDKEFNKKYSIDKRGMKEKVFCNMLNEPFNIQLKTSIDNKGKGCYCKLTIEELSNHFSMRNVKKNNNELNKALCWFIPSKLLEQNILSENDYSYSNVWQKIENYLVDRLLNLKIWSLKEWEENKAINGYLNNLIETSYDKKIIKSFNDFTIIKLIKNNRNKVIHDQQTDKIDEQLIPAIKEIVKKYCI